MNNVLKNQTPSIGATQAYKTFFTFFLSPFDAVQTQSLEDTIIVYCDFVYWYCFSACSCDTNRSSNVHFRLCSQKIHQKDCLHSNPLKSYKSHFELIFLHNCQGLKFKKYKGISCWIRKSNSISSISRKKTRKKFRDVLLNHNAFYIKLYTNLALIAWLI